VLEDPRVAPHPFVPHGALVPLLVVSRVGLDERVLWVLAPADQVLRRGRSRALDDGVAFDAHCRIGTRLRFLHKVTTAEAIAKGDVHAGVVMPATSTSPGCIWPKSAGPERTRAVAVTRPPLAATPLMVSPVCSSGGAGINPSKALSQAFSGRSCGGVTLLCPRQSILRCSTVSARLARCVSPASKDAAVCSSSSRRSQNTSEARAGHPLR
jgi:hypothetical protein